MPIYNYNNYSNSNSNNEMCQYNEIIQSIIKEMQQSIQTKFDPIMREMIQNKNNVQLLRKIMMEMPEYKQLCTENQELCMKNQELKEISQKYNTLLQHGHTTTLTTTTEPSKNEEKNGIILEVKEEATIIDNIAEKVNNIYAHIEEINIDSSPLSDEEHEEEEVEDDED